MGSSSRTHDYYKEEVIGLLIDFIPVGELIDRIMVSMLYDVNIKRLSPEELGLRSDKVFVEYFELLFGKVAEDKKKKILGLMNALLIVNSRIWGLEAVVRLGSDSKLSLDDIGRRTIEIRDLNKIRSEIKNSISYIYCDKEYKKKQKKQNLLED